MRLLSLGFKYALVFSFATTSASTSAEEISSHISEHWPSPVALHPPSRVDCKWFQIIPHDILDYIMSLFKKRDRIAMFSTCKFFADYRLPHLFSSYGLLYHSWIGEERDVLKLSVCPENEDANVNEFVLASKSAFVKEVYFSSFKYFILALQSGFTPKFNQKISFSSSNTSSFDSEMDLATVFQVFSQNLMSKLNINAVSVKSSDEDDILYFKSFLEYFVPENLYLPKLELTFNGMQSKSFEDLMSLLSNFSISSLLIEFNSFDFLSDGFLQLMERNALNLKEFHIDYTGSVQFVNDAIILINGLFPNIEQFESLQVFYSNLPIHNSLQKNIFAIIENADNFLLNHPKIKIFPNWSNLPELKPFMLLLSPQSPTGSLEQALQTALQRGVIHSMQVIRLSSFQDDDKKLIIQFVEENSQKLLIQRLFCDVDDFHDHFHVLNVFDLTLTHSGDSEYQDLPLSLSGTTQSLFCTEMFPVFAKTFPNLKTVYLRIHASNFSLDHFKALANSYQHLKLLKIGVRLDSDLSMDDLKQSISEIYAKSPRTFDEVICVEY